jgi:exosortase
LGASRIPPGILAWGAVIGALLFVLYREIGHKLALDWYNDPDYAHGFLVPVIAGWFVWDRRDKLARLAAAPSPAGILLLGLGLGMLVLGSIGAELFLQRSSLIAVIAGLVLLLLGRAFFVALLFPLAFLAFMVPLPAIVMNAVAFPLQLFAAQTASVCLNGLGIPVLREGNVINLAQTTLEVAEACSGIRSLQALLTLSVVYGYVAQRALWKRWVLFFAAIPIAIAANAFRVSGTGVLAHYFGLQVAQGFYHSFAGWLVFVVALALLMAVGKLLGRFGREPRPAAAPESPAASGEPVRSDV